MRLWLVIPAIAAGTLGAAALALLLALPHIDLAPFAARRASAALGHDVTIRALHVSPGRWLTIELDGLEVANVPAGTRPAMATLARLHAEVDALTLLSGPLLARRLTAEGLDVLLEHTGPDNAPNWRTAPRNPEAPPDYSALPTLLDATLQGRVTFRTTSGKSLVTTFDPIRIVAPDAASPLRLQGPGSYQSVPLALDATLASFDAVRAAPRPVASEIHLVSNDTNLTFKGTMRAPLELDGAQGELSLDAPTPTVIERIAGLDPAPAPPARLVGTLQHDGASWNLANTTGALGPSTLRGGDITFLEGRPDRVSLSLDFDRLDLDALLGATRAQPARPGTADLPLAVSPTPATLLDAKISAETLTYAGLQLAEPSIDAALQPGRIAVEALAFGYMGGQLKASGHVETLPGAAAPTARLVAELDITALDVQALRRALGAGSLPLSGRLTGRAHLEAEAATLNQAATAAHASAVLTLQNASISREIVELASTDARSLFRNARGMVPITCAVAIVDIRGGVATLSPLRIRSAAGTIVGRGQVNLLRRTLDLTIASEARTTGLFALDVPIRLTGPFENPSATPAALSAQARAQLATPDTLARLLPALQQTARATPCLERPR